MITDKTNDSLKKLSTLNNRLIATKVPLNVYRDDHSKALFEEIFRQFDRNCNFVYLPSFRRVLVTMSSPEAAFAARFKTQGWKLADNDSPASFSNQTLSHDGDDLSEIEGIRCYFAELDPFESRRLRSMLPGSGTNQTSFEEELLTDENPDESNDGYDRVHFLAPPKPQRTFLLSPPASPPVGWEPRVETEPVINYDLLNAIVCMEPGKEHELHPPCTERDQPSIVITPCEAVQSKSMHGALKIVHTARPNPNH